MSTSQEFAAAVQKEMADKMSLWTGDTPSEFPGLAKDGDRLMGQGSNGRILAQEFRRSVGIDPMAATGAGANLATSLKNSPLTLIKGPFAEEQVRTA